MLSEKYPASQFKKCNIKKFSEISKDFCYLFRIKFTCIKCKYYNNIISESKCLDINKGVYDNGRVVKAKSLIIDVTEVDLKLILKYYDFKSYEIIESYFAYKSYLPKEFYDFILDKYQDKTKLKGIPERKVEYNLAKNKFNSLYGMSVTNNICAEIDYKNNEWCKIELTNIDILMKLQEVKKKGFLNFAWGVYVTSYARRNLLELLRLYDDHAIYCDTDSIKLLDGYDKKYIDDYNSNVRKKLLKISNDLNLDFSKFEPEDIKGKKHLIGVFEFEGSYSEFKTLRCKKILLSR